MIIFTMSNCNFQWVSAVANLVNFAVVLCLFCISVPRSGSRIRAVLILSVHSNSCTDIRSLWIFKYYKKQYLNADRQKGIQIIWIFKYSSQAYHTQQINKSVLFWLLVSFHLCWLTGGLKLGALGTKQAAGWSRPGHPGL